MTHPQGHELTLIPDKTTAHPTVNLIGQFDTTQSRDFTIIQSQEVLDKPYIKLLLI